MTHEPTTEQPYQRVIVAMDPGMANIIIRACELGHTTTVEIKTPLPCSIRPDRAWLDPTSGKLIMERGTITTEEQQ